MEAVRTSIALLIVVIAGVIPNSAHAFPDGAPWGAANPAVEQNCAACHFGNEPVLDSAVLSLDGLPVMPTAGETYALTITFDHPDIVIAGFQLIATAGEESAGTFTTSGDSMEFIGASIRSVVPTTERGRAAWQINWRAPDTLNGPIEFFLAAAAANNDGSPFGDTIHFQLYRLPQRYP